MSVSNVVGAALASGYVALRCPSVHSSLGECPYNKYLDIETAVNDKQAK